MDVEAETFKFTKLLVFLERFEARRSGSNMDSDASKIDLGASFPRTRNTDISLSQ